MVSRKVTTAVRSELAAAKKLDSALGQAALVLAGRIDGGRHQPHAECTGADPASGMAAMVKELRTVLAALGANGAVADPIDDLRERRERRRRGA